MKNKIKKLYKKFKYMDKTKARYFIVAIFISAFCLFTGGAYSYFAISKHLEAAIITIGNLKYSLTSTNTNFKNNSITVPSGQTVNLTLTLKNLNPQNTKYALDALANSSDVHVYYVEKREQNVLGEIAGPNGVIDIEIFIENSSGIRQTITFDLKGGYLQNDLESNITKKKPSSPILAVSYNYKEKLWSQKTNIEKVVFENTLNPKEGAAYTYDISSAQDGSVMSYLVPTETDSTKYVAYIQSDEKIIANRHSSYLFRDFTSLKTIGGLEYLDTSNVTSMQQMFYNCKALTTIDVSNFDTSKVTDMYSMFDNCNALTTLDVSHFDTSKTTSMSQMFLGCNALTALDVSNFDTSNVTDMHGMFWGCNALTTLDVTNFGTSNVTSMSSMFYGCKALTALDVSNFDTSKVTNMRYMFSDCNALTTLDVSNFDTSNVFDMEGMFNNCNALTTLDLSNFDTSNVIYMSSMFSDCNALTTLDVSNFDTSNVINMSGMFSDCNTLTTLNLSNFDTSNVIDMSVVFLGCNALTTLDVSNFDTSNVIDMRHMFSGCKVLTTLDVSNFDTSNVTNMSGMFLGCNALTTLDVSNFDTSNVIDMNRMFLGCNALTTLNLSNFDTSNVINMENMFSDCIALTTTITIRGTNCEEYYNMFSLAATNSGAKIIVNYTADASDLVNSMIATKSSNSNVVKGQPEAEYSITLNGVSNATISGTKGYRFKNITLTPTEEGKVVTSFKMNGTTITGNSFKMPNQNVVISDVVAVEAFIVESEHNPYPDSLDNEVYLNKTFEGATSLTVILEYQTEDSDWICLYDKNYNPYGEYGGPIQTTKIITIPGDTICITFSTYYSRNDYYGFKAYIVPNYN